MGTPDSFSKISAATGEGSSDNTARDTAAPWLRREDNMVKGAEETKMRGLKTAKGGVKGTRDK